LVNPSFNLYTKLFFLLMRWFSHRKIIIQILKYIFDGYWSVNKYILGKTLKYMKSNKIGIHSMGKVIIFIKKEIIVQWYTFIRIGNTYITSYCNSSTKKVHIFIIYGQIPQFSLWSKEAMKVKQTWTCVRNFHKIKEAFIVSFTKLQYNYIYAS